MSERLTVAEAVREIELEVEASRYALDAIPREHHGPRTAILAKIDRLQWVLALLARVEAAPPDGGVSRVQPSGESGLDTPSPTKSAPEREALEDERSAIGCGLAILRLAAKGPETFATGYNTDPQSADECCAAAIEYLERRAGEVRAALARPATEEP